MKNQIYYSLLAFVVTISAGAFAQEGYTELPNAADRAKVKSGYLAMPGFDRLHIVKEGEGTPEGYAQWIRDPELKRLIQKGGFTSLQVRNLDIERSGIMRSTSLQTGEQQIVFPFMVSVKHTQRSDSKFNVDQGTIEVSGEILVHWDGRQAKVEVTNFDDSQTMERFGRRVLNANSTINLDFARKIVVPVLEGYFQSQPATLNVLLTIANQSAPSLRRP